MVDTMASICFGGLTGSLTYILVKKSQEISKSERNRILEKYDKEE